VPTNTQKRQLINCFRLAYDTKKGVGVCFSAHPGAVGLRIAPVTQDRQRS